MQVKSNPGVHAPGCYTPGALTPHNCDSKGKIENNTCGHVLTRSDAYYYQLPTLCAS